MKKSGKLVTGLLGLAMAVVTVLPALAAPVGIHGQKIWLPPNMVWTYGGEVTHNSSYHGAEAMCESVYPDKGGVDTFKVIRCRITDYYGNVISTKSSIPLKEGTGYQGIEIKQGYNHLGYIYFHFQGNSDSSANAIVSYNGTAYIP